MRVPYAEKWGAETDKLRKIAIGCGLIDHRRDGWTVTYTLGVEGVTAGFGSIAVAGPWKDKPTIFEFYVVSERRAHSFKLFEALLTASSARLVEIQSSDVLFAVMLHTYARDIRSEKVVFRDAITTALPANGATVRHSTSDQETRKAIAQRPRRGRIRTGAGQGGCRYRRPYVSLQRAVRRHLNGDCRTVQASGFRIVSGPGAQTVCVRARVYTVCLLQSR